MYWQVKLLFNHNSSKGIQFNATFSNSRWSNVVNVFSQLSPDQSWPNANCVYSTTLKRYKRAQSASVHGVRCSISPLETANISMVKSVTAPKVSDLVGFKKSQHHKINSSY